MFRYKAIPKGTILYGCAQVMKHIASMVENVGLILEMI